MPNKTDIDTILTKLKHNLSDEQKGIIYAPERFKLVSGGEQAGKSFTAGDYWTTRFWEGRRYWLVAADYERTRAEYNYICSNLDTLGISYDATSQVNPGTITIAGGITVETKSAKDPRTLAMFSPDGIIACEASQLDYETFLRLRSRIGASKGWLLMVGTFESSLGWYPELFNRWQHPNPDGGKSFILPSWANRTRYPGGREDPEIKALESMLPQDLFLERVAGVPCPPQGRVFPEFSTYIHTGTGGDYEFDPKYECYLWIDPGFAHYYAVEVAQKKGDYVYIVDELYLNHMTTSEVITVAKQRPWWHKVAGGCIDIAGTQHQAMPAPVQIWANEAGVPLRSAKVSIADGIDRVAASLKVNPVSGRPQLNINASCKGLISELGGCPNPDSGKTAVYEWRKDRDGNILGDVPDDKNNDAVKAVTYGLVDLLGFITKNRSFRVTLI